METREGQRQLVCESCGASFSCCPVPIGSCWCADIGVSNAVREELKTKFTECLCPECLVKHARPESAPPT